MILNAAEAGLAQSFAYLFSIYLSRGDRRKANHDNKPGPIASRVLLAACLLTQSRRWAQGLVSQPGGGYSLSEFCITVFIGCIGWIFIPTSAETAWFLTAEEKETNAPKEEARFYG